MERTDEKHARNARVIAEGKDEIAQGGTKHYAFVLTALGLPGMEEPITPVVVLTNEQDSAYAHIFRSQAELDAFIAHLQQAGEEAFGDK